MFGLRNNALSASSLSANRVRCARQDAPRGAYRPSPILPRTVAEAPGPLPHARLDMLARVLDRPLSLDKAKKQGPRMLKARCWATEDNADIEVLNIVCFIPPDRGYRGIGL
jgi:hypothetical protein